MPLAPRSRFHVLVRRPAARRPGASLVPGLIAAFLLSGCGSDDLTGPSSVGRVDPGGGTIEAQGGQVSLTFPPGAVSSDVEVTVEPAPAPPADQGLLPGSAFDFGPDGLQFEEPVELTIEFDRAELPEGALEAGLAIHLAVEDGWRRIEGSTVDDANGRVTAQINSFSVYAVVFVGVPEKVFTSGDAQTAVVGQAVATPPGVQVATEGGEPLSGIEVQFSVADGGGTITGAGQVTDVKGQATVGSWVLGTTVGANRLQAAVEGLETPVVFDAEAVAGPPASIAAERGDSQSAPVGASVEVPPAVRVADEFGNPAPGVEVSFSADAGGTVEPPVVATGADGVAGVDTWTLGEVGTNSLTASAVGLGPVTFSASAFDACEEPASLSPGATVSGELAGTDCQLESGRLTDKFDLSLSGQSAFSASFTSSDFEPALFTFGGDRQVHGAGAGGGTGVTVDFVLPTGSYQLLASSVATEPVTGAYTLATETVTGDPTTGCLRLATVVTGGVTVDGAISDGDCVVDFLGQPDVLRRFDHYALLVFPGETATVSLTAGHEWALSLLDDGEFVTEIRNQAPGSRNSISYSPDEASFLVFTHWNEIDGETGSYSVSFSGSGSAPAASRRSSGPSTPLLVPVEDSPVPEGPKGR